jgi:hypothetical protein
MVSLIAGSASPTRLLFSGIWMGLIEMSLHTTLVSIRNKIATGGTPVAPATLAIPR